MPYPRFLSVASLAVVAALFAPSLFAQDADLVVEKNAPATAMAGSTITYTLTITNAGPDDAIVPEIDDTLPNGLIYVSGTQTGGITPFICSEPSVGATMGNFTCSAQTLAAFESATFTVVETVPIGAVAGTEYDNTASVFSMANDPGEENNSVTVATIITEPTGDVSVTKSGPSDAPPGANVAYSISVTNAGPDPATNVSLTDTLPGTMTFVSFTQDSGPAFNCGMPGTMTTCTIASLPVNATATFTFTGNIPMATAGGTVFDNTANVTASNDMNSENNSSTTELVVATADLNISKTAPAMATAGGTYSFDVSFHNNGPNPAENARFTDALPAGTTFAAITTSGNCITPAVNTNGTITCGFGTLNPGPTLLTTITVNVLPSVANGTVLNNTATAATDTTDTNNSNDSASAATTVVASADLAVIKTGATMATAGATASYTLTITNNGPSDAQSVSLADPAPAGTTFSSEMQNSGPTFSCANGTCTIGTLAAGASATFTYTLQVNPSASGVITNTATGTTSTTDPNGGNNSASQMTSVSASADIAVTKTGGANAAPGGPVSYTLTITNNGPSDAQNVSLSDPTPANETFVSEPQNSGPAFNCANGTCTIATLAAGATASFTYNATVSPAALPNSMITNTATGSTTTTDPTPGNNSASATTNVGFPTVDLSIVKNVATPPPYGTGLQLTYNINVTNGSMSTTASGVTVTDVLPAGSTYVSAMSTVGTCMGGPTVTCNIGTLAGGGSATITLTITMPQTAGPLSNTATVTSSNPDANPGDNTSTATITVLPAQEIPATSTLTLLLLGAMIALIALRVRS